MIHEALFGEGFVFCAGATVVCIRIDAYTATGSEKSDNLDILRIHQLYQILHNHIYTILVEITMVAELNRYSFRLLLSTIFSPGIYIILISAKSG